MILALLVPDGIGVRNFLLGRFLGHALEKAEVVSLHGIPNELLPIYSGPSNGSVQWHTLRPYRDRAGTFFLRNAMAYAQMYWADTFSMRLRRGVRIGGSLAGRLARRTARLVGRASASKTGIRVLERLHQSLAERMPEVEHYRQLFREIKPSVLFCSHQRPSSILPPVLAARSMGIPTATFIFSWDNLTSKGRIAAPFDHYLVWSDSMSSELLRFYPDVVGERIHKVGTPQFAPYADKSLLWSRQEFLTRIGADPSRALLCYSGGDPGNCPDDPKHLKILLDLVREGSIAGKPRILLRPSPVDGSGRYDEVRRSYPELIYAPPSWVHWQPQDWSQSFPLPDDPQFLVNLTYYADVNINVCSTMTLDFAIHDKPVVNIAFDATSPPPFGMSLWDHHYQKDHYRPVVELGAARFAHSPDELATHVNAYLKNPALDREGRRQFVDLEVGVPTDRSIERIVDVLEQIAV